jgi:hypothetical protein
MRAQLDRELDDARGDVVGDRRRQRLAPAAAPLRVERRDRRLDGRPVPGRRSTRAIGLELRLAYNAVSRQLRARGIALPGRGKEQRRLARVRPIPGRRCGRHSTAAASSCAGRVGDRRRSPLREKGGGAGIAANSAAIVHRFHRAGRDQEIHRNRGDGAARRVPPAPVRGVLPRVPAPF